MPASIRASEADPVTSASSETSWALSPPGRALGRDTCAPLPKAPMTCDEGSSPAGRGAVSAAISSLYACGERRTVCAALLIRMSSGPSAATESASATTWAGSRRSIPTIFRRWIHSALSGIDLKRRIASLGKRVVMVVCAPSRSSRSAMYMPIFARPPVSSARLPVRSVRASRRERFSAAQSRQSWW